MNYLGILTNVDSSIMLLNLNEDFKIKKEKISDVIKTIYKSDNINEMQYMELLDRNYVKPDDEGNVFTIHNSYLTSEDIITDYNRFNDKLIYLNNLFKKLKLFKEGNICYPPLFYVFPDNNCKNQSLGFDMKRNTNKYIASEIFHLERSEIPKLNSFIKSIEIPFKANFLEFAFKNFELSFDIHDKNLRFLTLMNGIEALFNPSGAEIRFRISRSLATLLGKSKGDALKIEEVIKKMYDKRSNIVHSGNADIKEEEILTLRAYLRESIIGFHILNQNKDDILKSLNSSGFGDSPLKNILSC